jgi:hypothetical protein
MATATAPAPAAPVEIVSATPAKKESKRPRPNVNVIKVEGQPMSFPIFATEKDAEGKEPKLGAVTVTKNADGTEKETIDTARAIPCEGYRLCKVTRKSDKKEVFTYARSTDLALANVAAADYESVFTDAKKRGRSAKVDPIYKNFLEMLIKAGNLKDATEFVTAHPIYAQFMPAGK